MTSTTTQSMHHYLRGTESSRSRQATAASGYKNPTAADQVPSTPRRHILPDQPVRYHYQMPTRASNARATATAQQSPPRVSVAASSDRGFGSSPRSSKSSGVGAGLKKTPARKHGQGKGLFRTPANKASDGGDDGVNRDDPFVDKELDTVSPTRDGAGEDVDSSFDQTLPLEHHEVEQTNIESKD